MKVLVGRKQPRIVYQDSSNEQIIGLCDTFMGGHTNLAYDSIFEGFTELEKQACINTCIYGLNNSDEVTWSVITGYGISPDDKNLYAIYHNDWNNSIPKVGSQLTSKYYGYDLPYCQNNLIEKFDPQVIVTQLFVGTKDVNIKGFWYSAVLDYSKKITPSTTKAFSKLYDATRTSNVMLYPRRDNLSVGYQIDIDPNHSIVLAQKMNHLGMKMFKASVIGVTRLSSVGLDPTLMRLVTEDGNPIIIDSDGYYILGE